jgi:response regulator RpfG family c-di-GMP phosphodiesterase
MLHDVGNIAVSDVILKKPGALTNDEILVMRQHTVLGARLFRRTTSFWDYMAAEVALNHHENWDGSGYPGRIENIFAPKIYMGPGKLGTDIPLSARVVAIADVYDAIVSARVYRPAWEQKHALRFIQYQAGKKFDPELVKIFVEMGDVLTAV